MAGEDRISAGFRYVFYGVANSSGYLQGNAAAAASNGTIQRMSRLRGAQSYPAQIPDRDRVPVSGDDEPLVNFDFASENLPNGVLAVAVRDLGFEALTQGTKEESLGDLRAGALGPSGEAGPTMMLLLMRKSKKFEGSTKGVGGWEFALIPSCTITPLGSEWQQRTFNPYNYAVTISKAGRAPYGATYTEGLRGTTELAIEPMNADNPIEIYGGFGNGSATTFALTTAPVSADGNKTHVYLNGVKQYYTTHYTVSGTTLTFLSAPGNGVHIGYMQEVSEGDLA